MKIIQSFWTGNKNSLTDSYGWLLPIFNYLSWIISCYQLRRYYDDVTLVTDSQGYDVLINKLHLPYTDVIVSLDCLNHYNPNLWALANLAGLAVGYWKDRAETAQNREIGPTSL